MIKNFIKTLALVPLILGMTAPFCFAARYSYPIQGCTDSVELVSVAKSIYNDLFPLTLAIQVHNVFSQAAKETLAQAAHLLLRVALDKDTIDCAYRASTKDFPTSREDFELQLAHGFLLRTYQSFPTPAMLFVSGFQENSDVVGVAYENLFFDKNYPLPGYQDKHYFHIALNLNYLDDESFSGSRDPGYWAGVIAHEMLHNLNYKHPTGYSGSFMNEYGECVSKMALGCFATGVTRTRNRSPFHDVVVTPNQR